MKNTKLAVKKQYLKSFTAAILLIFSFLPVFSQVTPPENLSATAVSSSVINLHWNTDSAGSQTASFIIERRKDGIQNFTYLASVNGSIFSYSDQNLLSYTLYYYRVRSLYSDSSFSPYSNIASARTLQDSGTTGVPNAPSDLVAMPLPGCKIRLIWTDNSNNETGFRIYRKLNDSASNWMQTASVGQNVTNFLDDSGLVMNTLYCYMVSAYNSYGNSSFSNISCAMTFPDSAVVLPANGSSGQSVTPLIDWFDVVSYIDISITYRIQIATDPNFSNIIEDQSGLSSSQYQVTSGTLLGNNTYHWRVFADLSSGDDYWVGAWNFSTAVIGISQTSMEIPVSSSLTQNYPNPFNPVTKIKFDVSGSGTITSAWVNLRIYDVSGRVVAILVDNQLTPGKYEVDFDASNLASGVYFYSMESGDFRESRKMLLVK